MMAAATAAGSRRAVWALALLVAAAAAGAAAQQPVFDWKWRAGRATHFSTPEAGRVGIDWWSIHNGSCNYQYIFPQEPLGWDVAALTDVIMPDYPDSCGRCYEVACDTRWIGDLYGASFDRTQACIDPSASVIVRIADVCPCTYPTNAYSNKRWCCGDIDHLDMSVWAFEKLAETRWGVIAVKYRPVPCTYKPWKKAKPSTNPTPGIPAPLGASPPVRDWPEYQAARPGPLPVYTNGSFHSGFHDASWNTWVQPASDSSTAGRNRGPALCASVKFNGALTLRASAPGIFSQYVAVEFWIYAGQTGGDNGAVNQVPGDIRVNVAGPKGGCSPTRLWDVKPTHYQPIILPYGNFFFWSYRYYFPVFAGVHPDSMVINSPSAFGGCGGNRPDELLEINFRNDANWGGDRWLCIDNVQLM